MALLRTTEQSLAEIRQQLQRINLLLVGYGKRLTALEAELADLVTKQAAAETSVAAAILAEDDDTLVTETDRRIILEYTTGFRRVMKLESEPEPI